jgi:aryl-alcohol dehydrogenase-like predicted oxidoreductase
MDYRTLGASGLKVPALSFGAGTFGGTGPLFSAWGNSDVAGARRLIDICLEAGVTLFDTADVYSNGARRRCSAPRSRPARPGPDLDQDRPADGRGPNDAGASRTA